MDQKRAVGPPHRPSKMSSDQELSESEHEMSKLPTSAQPEVYLPALSWWERSTRELGHLPGRAHLDPVALGARALRFVMIVEIIGRAEDMRFRLVGSSHDEFNGRSLTGQLFSAVYPSGSPILSYVRGLYLEMIEARRPIWSLNSWSPEAGLSRVRMGRLMMPLSTNGLIVDGCVAVQKIDYPDFSEPIVRNSWIPNATPYERERMII